VRRATPGGVHTTNVLAGTTHTRVRSVFQPGTLVLEA
jgi:hypothetical protein